MSQRKKKRTKKYNTIHTRISWWLIIIAFGVELLISLLYINSEEAYDQQFGKVTLMEAGFALLGFTLADFWMYGRISFKKDYRPLQAETGMRFSIIFILLFATQFIFQFLLLQVKELYKAFAIWFAAPAEEAFFRAFLISIFIRTGENDKARIKIGKKYMTPTILLGVIISAVGFMAIHVNYYDQLNMMIALLVSGLILGFAYWYWEDITSCILAHLLVNTVAIIRVIDWTQIFMVSL